jgi:molybdenum cofactor cytidylyltransferase
MSRIGLMLLAAGSSRRMGRPKQLLEYKGKTLLRRAAEEALNSDCRPVVVVLGNYIRRCAAELQGLNVTFAINRAWAAGMGSSIHCGLRAILGLSPNVEAIVIMLCDQPLVEAQDLRQLIDAFAVSGAEVCASRFGETFGPPCLFSKSLFPKLLAIDESAGAKSLITGNVAWVECDRARTDVDTREDWENLNA